MLHIELRRWADMMVIAPLDANTLAKMVHGICDNLLVSSELLYLQSTVKILNIGTCMSEQTE